jgi:hypothetical protein
MSYDDDIMRVFQEAARKGRKEISSEAILLMTNVPPQLITRKLETMSKYGIVKPTKVGKPAQFWRLGKLSDDDDF